MVGDTTPTSHVFDIDPRLCHLRVKTSTVSASDVWAWPMHKMLFLSFQIASTVRILRLKPCVLDSRFLTENLPFFPAAQLWGPPSSVKPQPGVRRAELEAMESEQFSLSLPPSPGHHRINSPVQFLRLSCTQPGGTGHPFLRIEGYFI